jgi:iron complex transport system ATP-binding protein
MKPPALDIRDVSYLANGKKIIDAVSWRVEPREHWAILGPNGSGKTTLLKLACGYLWPNAGGEIYRRGKRMADLRELRQEMGWVTAGLVAQVPAREIALRTVVSGRYAQVGLVEGPWGRPTAKDYHEAGAYLEEIGAGRLADHEFGTLSQGEQQKVLIARARMTRPYLIFLDEPCAGMDPGARESFLASLAKLARLSKIPSLIYVTHHVEEILPIFKKTLVLKEGRVIAAGATRSVMRRSFFAALYGAKFGLRRSRGRYWPLPV